MPCADCGADLARDAAFCHRCGGRVSVSRGAFGPIGADEPMEPAPPDPIERDLWKGGYSPRAMLGHGVLACLSTVAVPVVLILAGAGRGVWLALAALVLIAWAVLFLVVAYRRMEIHYELTSQRLVHRSGLVRRVTDRVELIDVDDITFEQGPIERIVGVGTIRITSSDRTHPELAMRGIEAVGDVAATIDDARRRERHRRGLHIEAI